MYLLEIAPFNLKGAFGTANQLFVTVGIFFGSVLGLREILGDNSIKFQIPRHSLELISDYSSGLNKKNCVMFLEQTPIDLLSLTHELYL